MTGQALPTARLTDEPVVIFFRPAWPTTRHLARHNPSAAAASRQPTVTHQVAAQLGQQPAQPAARPAGQRAGQSAAAYHAIPCSPPTASANAERQESAAADIHPRRLNDCNQSEAAHCSAQRSGRLNKAPLGRHRSGGIQLNQEGFGGGVSRCGLTTKYCLRPSTSGPVTTLSPSPMAHA